jgi:cell division protein FtsL
MAWPRYFWAWLLLLLILVVAAFVHVHAKLTAVELGYALSTAASEHQQLVSDQHSLQIEVATLRSPQRLRKLAIEKLGLVEPNVTQLFKFRQSLKKEHTVLSRMTNR